MDSQEPHEMLARSQNQMKRTLNWWNLIWFDIGSIMGAGIFILTGEVARNNTGSAVVLSYFISSLLAFELTVTGGLFAYQRVELGDFVAYVAAENIPFEYMVSGASVARS
ncbi:Amino acid/polyamine transporter [Parasponia andersonii]|uniref:Amino acid/polyamine transporter n=1 Tax=Parasponia andersonii TaxID=3476 RepID=A0A2P5C111_PARAD|nr:Amino acid/polyamine transporter [Parasponia andersonii]